MLPAALGEPKEPVVLHVYDIVVPNLEVAKWNTRALALGFGAFHTGVELYNVEACYTKDQGVTFINPKQAVGCTYRKAIPLGNTIYTLEEVSDIIQTLRSAFKAHSYDLLHFNCNHFSTVLCQILVDRPVPRYINKLATFGDWLVRYVPKAKTLLGQYEVNPMNQNAEAEENEIQFKEAQKAISNKDMDQLFLAYLEEQSAVEDLEAYKHLYHETPASAISYDGQLLDYLNELSDDEQAQEYRRFMEGNIKREEKEEVPDPEKLQGLDTGPKKNSTKRNRPGRAKPKLVEAHRKHDEAKREEGEDGESSESGGDKEKMEKEKESNTQKKRRKIVDVTADVDGPDGGSDSAGYPHSSAIVPACSLSSTGAKKEASIVSGITEKDTGEMASSRPRATAHGGKDHESKGKTKDPSTGGSLRISPTPMTTIVSINFNPAESRPQQKMRPAEHLLSSKPPILLSPSYVTFLCQQEGDDEGREEMIKSTSSTATSTADVVPGIKEAATFQMAVRILSESRLTRGASGVAPSAASEGESGKKEIIKIEKKGGTEDPTSEERGEEERKERGVDRLQARTRDFQSSSSLLPECSRSVSNLDDIHFSTLGLSDPTTPPEPQPTSPRIRIVDHIKKKESKKSIELRKEPEVALPHKESPRHHVHIQIENEHREVKNLEHHGHDHKDAPWRRPSADRLKVHERRSKDKEKEKDKEKDREKDKEKDQEKHRGKEKRKSMMSPRSFSEKGKNGKDKKSDHRYRAILERERRNRVFPRTDNPIYNVENVTLSQEM